MTKFKRWFNYWFFGEWIDLTKMTADEADTFIEKNRLKGIRGWMGWQTTGETTFTENYDPVCNFHDAWCRRGIWKVMPKFTMRKSRYEAA